MEFYDKAKSKYELAYTEEYLVSTEVTYVEYFSDWWNKYSGFFMWQIPDLRLIDFGYGYCKENDCRLITYRILNLGARMKR